MSDQTIQVDKSGQLSIEQCLAKLTEISHQMTDKNISMDEAMRLYKDGLHLADKADAMLNKYEQDIEVMEEGPNE